MTRAPTTWTRPYFGVQHLKGLPTGYQITVEDCGEGYFECYVLFTPSGFLPVHSAVRKSREKARAWGERKARELGLVRPRRKTRR